MRSVIVTTVCFFFAASHMLAQTNLSHTLATYAYSDKLLGHVGEYERSVSPGNTTKVRLVKLLIEGGSIVDFYKVTVDGLREGDLIRLEAQVEATNDLHVKLTDVDRGTTFNDCSPRAVLFAIRLKAIGPSGSAEWIGPWATMNITTEMHHAPLRVSGVYVVQGGASGDYTFFVSGHGNTDSVAGCNRFAHLSIEGIGDPANPSGVPYGAISAFVFRSVNEGAVAITNAARAPTGLALSGSGGSSGSSFRVLSSPDVDVSVANWPAVLTNAFDSNGNFSVTSSSAHGETRIFYTVEEGL